MNTRKIRIGNITIGGGEPVRIQSMTNTDTMDTDLTLAQIDALEKVGCEIVRVAAYNVKSAKNIENLKKGTSLPIVADVHFDYRIAVAAIEAGADKIRINPGNIGDRNKVEIVVDAAKAAGIPIRVGANSGSIRKDLLGHDKVDALITSAMDNIRMLEEHGFYDIVVSLKSSDARECIEAYRRISEMVDYPLHLGVTEAGGIRPSSVKSAIAIGALLVDGIGDTVRVSVTGDPVEEIGIAKDILRFAGVRKFGAEVISCPTCARTSIDVAAIAAEIEEYVKELRKPVKIAVMGCEVNGPGEAADADLGIAGGKDCGLIFMARKPVKRVDAANLLKEFKSYIDKLF